MRALTLKPGPLPRRAFYVPDYSAASVAAIDWTVLYEQGIAGVAVDLDSTLMPHGARHLTPDTITALTEPRRTAGILKLCLATNRRPHPTITALATALDASGIVSATGLSRKPAASYFARVSRCLDLPPRRCAMIGDKLWQDIYGANRAGFTTILVEPLGPAAWFDRLLLHRWRQTRLLSSVQQDLIKNEQIKPKKDN